MKSHLLLLRVVLNEMGARCCTSTSHDFKTIMTRTQSEGMSFLTISLPNFCSDFQKSLDLGQVDPSFFAGFTKKGYLPRFLGGFTDLIFERVTGRLLEDPSIDAIQAVRQITLLFGKINLPCSDARTTAAMNGFIECEKQVRETDRRLEYSDILSFRTLVNRLWGGVLCAVDKVIYDGGILPKHGPGTTADRIIGNKKYDQNSWTKRLEAIFPHEEFLFSNVHHFCDAADVHLLEPGQELPVRVVTVPKTQKTPRIIAIEPTCMQYVQQGLLECLKEKMGEDNLLTTFIDFDDQIPNQEMARIGSLNGSLATLDLSEASDRVSNQLVRNLLANTPYFLQGVDACRSRKADVPGHGVIRLAKFASMGSALCFPFEAIVFLTVVLLGIQDELRRPLTRRDLLDLQGKVRVYGDDIIVPVEYVRSVVGKLQTFGFVVNTNKSFWTGMFRESCGKEYFKGEDVSVVRVREALPTQRRHVPEIISTASLRNQMYFAGNWETARFLDEWMERLIPFPTVWPESPAIGRHTLLDYESQKECRYLHRSLVKAYVVHAKSPPSKLEGQGALVKWFLKRGEEPFADRDHLERAGRPDAVNIKLRWVPSY